MSLSLDDKLLGEKVHNYCSSSEDDESVSCSEAEDVEAEPSHSKQNPITYDDRNSKTGPKGVLSDYNHFKSMQREQRCATEKMALEYAKKCSFACKPLSDDLREQSIDNAISEEIGDADSDDEFLDEYRKKRMSQLREAFENLPIFNKIFDLTAENFVDEIDNVGGKTTVIVHIYENNRACAQVNRALETIYKEYSHVKFCRIRASDAHLSRRFSLLGVPAIVVYKRGDLIGNLLSITRDLGDDFYTGDFENYLVEHGFLPDKSIISLLNSRLRTSTN